MFQYKYDTHVHTSETSSCARVSGKEVARYYKNLGYQGIVITDHFTKNYFDSLGSMTWEKKVDAYLEGYKNANNEGNSLDLDVILGIEVNLTTDYNDYLIYGVNEEFLKENQKLYNLKLQELRKLVNDNSMLLYQAHPFRDWVTVANPLFLDGVEVYNGSKRWESKNAVAYEFAKKNQLKMISGSDFHSFEDPAVGGIYLEKRVSDSLKFVEVIREQDEFKLILDL